MAGFKRHVFVCLNERDPGDARGCCKHRGSEDVFNALKKGAAKAGLGHDVRINRAGCLDHCQFGPTVVVYPEGVWYSCATKEDIDEVLQKHLVEGGRVERLMLKTADKLPKDRVKA